MLYISGANGSRERRSLPLPTNDRRKKYAVMSILNMVFWCDNVSLWFCYFAVQWASGIFASEQVR